MTDAPRLQPAPKAEPTEFQHRAWDNEAAILAALVTSSRASRVFDYLEEADFSFYSYRLAYSAARTLHNDGLTISLLTLGDQLDRDGKRAEFKIHGTSYTGLDGLARIGESAPRGNELDSIVQQVKDYSANRRLIEVANNIAQGALSGRTSAEVLAEAENQISKIAASRAVRVNQVRNFRDVARTASERVERAAKGEVAIPTGLTDLDALSGGIYKGDLILVAGRPGNGKSSLLSTVAYNMAEIGKRVGILTLEMSNEDYFNRMASQVSGVTTDVLRSGKLDSEQWVDYYAAVEALSEYPVQTDDTPAVTPAILRRKAREMAKTGLDILFLDYIGLMESGDKSENRVQEISQISRACKNLARELDIPFVAACQLNRSVEQRSSPEPFLSDLRDSGSLEQDADVVMFIYRSETAGFSDLKLAKARNGPTGTVPLAFDTKHTVFKDAVRRRFSL